MNAAKVKLCSSMPAATIPLQPRSSRSGHAQCFGADGLAEMKSGEGTLIAFAAAGTNRA